MSKPRIDVLLPVFNGEAFLLPQVDSILAQTGVEVRLLILDDGSTDGSSSVIQQLSGSDSRIDVVPSEGNVGHTAAILDLLGRVQAPFFALSDQDDIWNTDKLSRSLECLGDHGLLAYSDVVLIDSAGTTITNSYWRSRGLDASPTDNPLRFIYRNPAIGHTMVGRRSVAELASRLSPDLRHHEAFLVGVALSLGGPVVPVPQTLGQYRQHEGNLVGPLAASFRSRALAALDADVAQRRRSARLTSLQAVASVLPQYGDLPALASTKGRGRATQALRYGLRLHRHGLGLRVALSDAVHLAFWGSQRQQRERVSS